MAVVGAVGSGKSSLIQAILGEMDVIEGCVNVNVSTCICGHAQHMITMSVLPLLIRFLFDQA